MTLQNNFNANISKAYGAQFDASTWTPIGTRAVESDAGMDTFVQQPLEAKEAEFRLAGDSLSNYFNVLNQKEMSEAQLRAYDAAKGGGGGGSSGGSSGLGSTIGSGLGFGLSMAIPGAQPFAPVLSSLGGKIGGLFG